MSEWEASHKVKEFNLYSFHTFLFCLTEAMGRGNPNHFYISLLIS